jgi:ribosomal protein L11 methylase PrmA
MKIVDGSFRDPQANVYISDGRIFRVINDSGKEKFNFLTNSLILKKSVENKYLIDTWIPEKNTLPDFFKEKIILEHKKIPFISYPYEWSFNQLKDAAIHHLSFQIFLLENNIQLTDSSAYNIQFVGNRPIFIDCFSLSSYKEGDFWYGQKQFYEQFLNPLLLSSLKNISFNNWYKGSLEGIKNIEILSLLNFFEKFSPKILFHTYLPTFFEKKINSDKIKDEKFLRKNKFKKNSYLWILNNLKKTILNLKSPRTKSYWENYEKTSSYEDKDSLIKSEIVKEFIIRTKPDTVADLGCNTGYYSELCLNNGCKYVVGFDNDIASVEKSYTKSIDKKLNFLPLFFDATNPSSNIGWFENERYGFLKRAKFDASLFLAFEHHLIIGKNIPIESFLKWATLIGYRGLIEFVPKTDKMIKVMLNLKGDIFPDYNEENFLNILKKYSKIIKINEIGSMGRKIIEFDAS